MARGNGKMRIFLDDRDYRRFVYVLSETMVTFAVRCWNYCLMPNHYHLTIQPSRPNLSKAIARLNGVYGLWWNRRHGQVGHVFQGRFKDQIVDREGYLITLSRYVVMNPVQAGLVSHPQDWHWSSYRATVGLSSVPAFLDVSATLELFGGGEGAGRSAQFASAMTDVEPDMAQLDCIRSNERILGSMAFKQHIEGVARLARAADDASGSRLTLV